MATFSIAGNVGTLGTVGEIIYCQNLQSTAAPQPQPAMTVSDANKNYSFTGLVPGVYQLFTAAKPGAKQVVTIVANNIVDLNFSS